MSLFQRMWRRLGRAQHTRALETEVARQSAEIARLRAENRALLNSILGIAGIPPIPAIAPELRPATSHSGSGTPDDESLLGASLPGTKAAERDSPGEGGPRNDISYHASTPLQVAAPMRRRSWHQISRLFEFEAARKKESGNSV